ncbi:MAG: hypothetical protein J3Q66DRAFT_344707 [Benniella sp.]|nr:MAG: hypothetical protein J3Q66DRAFT_344707 [Benniella sp.]
MTLKTSSRSELLIILVWSLKFLPRMMTKTILVLWSKAMPGVRLLEGFVVLTIFRPICAIKGSGCQALAHANVGR